jgi:hypothetical protein
MLSIFLYPPLISFICLLFHTVTNLSLVKNKDDDRSLNASVKSDDDSTSSSNSKKMCSGADDDSSLIASVNSDDVSSTSSNSTTTANGQIYPLVTNGDYDQFCNDLIHGNVPIPKWDWELLHKQYPMATKLGEGGYKTVYMAVNASTKQVVALSVM